MSAYMADTNARIQFISDLFPQMNEAWNLSEKIDWLSGIKRIEKQIIQSVAIKIKQGIIYKKRSEWQKERQIDHLSRAGKAKT